MDQKLVIRYHFWKLFRQLKGVETENMNSHPLAKLRKEKKLNQEQLATRLGISERAVGKIERSEQIPNYKQAKIIGEYFEINWHYFIDLCVRESEKKRQVSTFYQKLSEKNDCSTDCTNQVEKCGAR